MEAEPVIPLNRASRRVAARNGVAIPIISMRMYPDGSVIIDNHGDIRKADLLKFLEQVKGIVEQKPDD